MGTKFHWLWGKICSGFRLLRGKIQQHPLIATEILVALIILAFALAVHSFGWDWTGFNGGYSKRTVTSTVHGTTIATEQPAMRTLWDLLLLANSIVTTLAIFAAGWWFITNRSLAETAQISLSLKDVTIVNGVPIVIVGVQIKNLGHTRIVKDICWCNTKTIDVWTDSEPISIISEEPFRKSSAREIFKSLKEIEPNEEISWDIAFALNKTTLFMVSVEFKQKGMIQSWRAVAVFNAGHSKLN